MDTKEKLLDIREKLDGRVLVGDGALGTLLADHGLDQPYIADLSDESVVRAVHEECLRASAKVIQTNTFLANRLTLAARNLERKVREINVEGARLARGAVDSLPRGEDTFILGCGAYLMPSASMPHLAGDVIEPIEEAES